MNRLPKDIDYIIQDYLGEMYHADLVNLFDALQQVEEILHSRDEAYASRLETLLDSNPDTLLILQRRGILTPDLVQTLPLEFINILLSRVSSDFVASILIEMDFEPAVLDFALQINPAILQAPRILEFLDRLPLGWDTLDYVQRIHSIVMSVIGIHPYILDKFQWEMFYIRVGPFPELIADILNTYPERLPFFLVDIHFNNRYLLRLVHPYLTPELQREANLIVSRLKS